VFILSQELLKKLFFIALIIFSVFLFFSKLDKIPESGYASYDGAFYSDIALHIYNGDGLLTSISSFDQFYKVLPRPTQVYPFWPLVGGSLAHLFPHSVKFVIRLEFINLIFSIFSIYVLYFLILNILKKESSKKYIYAFIFTIAFNCMATYYYYSIKPYTESLAIFLILLSLLIFFNVLDYANKKYNSFMSFLLGVLLFLSFLTRSQSVISIFVVFLFSVYFLITKQISKKSFFITWITSLLLLTSYFYYFYLIKAEYFDLSSFFIFQNNYDLSKYTPLPHVKSNPIYLRILHGLKAFFAFDYTSGVPNSGILIFLLPATLIKFKYYNIKFKIIIITGGFYLLSLLSMEMTITLKWLFGHRHGILVLFLTLFSFLAFIIYLETSEKFKNIYIFFFTSLILFSSVYSSRYVRNNDKSSKIRFSHKTVNKLYSFLISKQENLNRKLKILSLNSRNIVLFSGTTGYFFESRRENWKEYLIYKMRKLNIDYFIINKYYDYYTKDKKDDYFTIMKDKTPKEFKLVKSFEDKKLGNWLGIYKLVSNK